MEKKEETKEKSTYPLKEVLDKNFYSNQNNEFKNFILPKDQLAEASFEKQMNSIINALSEEVDLNEAIKQASCLEETILFKERNKTDKEAVTMINEAIESCFTSSYQMISEEFQKKLNENLRNKNYTDAFEMFGEKPKTTYKPDNDFIRYLCLGLINIDDIKELNIDP
ncbi:MAG: hypothetical protein MJ252_16195 [archaeon]|nr:hypothetical protein [archaeon]